VVAKPCQLLVRNRSKNTCGLELVFAQTDS